MRRASWLIAYSHDHQHTLAAALRLRRASDNPAANITTAAQAFLETAHTEIAAHMHREEAQLLPALWAAQAIEPDEAVRLTLEHMTIRSLTLQLDATPADRDVARTLANTVRDHVRWEERELFQALQDRVQVVHETPLTSAPHTDLRQTCMLPTDGTMLGLAHGELHATLATVPPRHTVALARLRRDMAIVIATGSGMLIVDMDTSESDNSQAIVLAPGTTTIVSTGARLRLIAHADGLGWIGIEQRRDNSWLQPMRSRRLSAGQTNPESDAG